MKTRPSFSLRLLPGRRVPAGQVDHELIWGSLLLLLLLAAWNLPHWREAATLYPCPFRLMTGRPCLLCGGTRAVYFLTHGAWRQAFGLNPLAAVLGIVGAGYVLYAATALACGRRLRLAINPTPGWRLRWALALALGVLAAANWLYVMRVGVDAGV